MRKTICLCSRSWNLRNIRGARVRDLVKFTRSKRVGVCRIIRYAMVLCSLVTVLIIGSVSASAQTRFVETFEESSIDAGKWYLYKAPVYSSAREILSLDGKTRFFRHTDGELGLVVPPNPKGREQFAIASKFGLAGDYNLRLSYAIPNAIPVPEPGGYVNFEITASGADGSVHFARTAHGKHGHGYSLFFRPSERRETELRATAAAREKKVRQTPKVKKRQTVAGTAEEKGTADGQEELVAAESSKAATPPESDDSPDHTEEHVPNAPIRMWRFLSSETLQDTMELERRGSRLIARAGGVSVGSIPVGHRSIDQITVGIVVQGTTHGAFEAAVSEIEVHSDPAHSGEAPQAQSAWLLFYGVVACTVVFLSVLLFRRITSATGTPPQHGTATNSAGPSATTTGDVGSDASLPAANPKKTAENITDFDIS